MIMTWPVLSGRQKTTGDEPNLIKCDPNNAYGILTYNNLKSDLVYISEDGAHTLKCVISILDKKSQGRFKKKVCL